MKCNLSNIVIFVFLFLFACSSPNEKEDTIVHTNSEQSDIIYIDSTKLQITQINPDSLTVITPGKNNVPLPKVVLAGEPKITPNRLTSILVEEATVIEIDTNKLTRIIPGQGNTSLPKKYAIPKIDYLVQHGDTTHAPKTILAKQPKPIPALVPRYKDAASYNIQYLDIEQGMPSSYVASIVEDKKGNLWFGTSGGVSRYDGKSFTNFTEAEGLTSNNISSILEDKKGNLWFATLGGGVSCYDGKSFTNFTESEGLASNFVYSILEDKNGNLWFATRGGVSRYDEEYFTNFTESEGLANSYTRAILEDKKGNIWFATRSGVSRYDGESFINFTKSEGLINNYVYSVLQDKEGNIWFGTRSGVSRYDGKSFTSFSKTEGLMTHSILSILEDNNGGIWFATNNNGVSYYDGDSFTNFTDSKGLPNNYVKTILEDKSGNLWFATYGGGVSCYNKKSFTSFTELEGLVNKFIFSIIEDKNKNIWFATANGVSRYDGKSFTSFAKSEGLAYNFVYSLLEDKNGNIWFGTDRGGVSCYDGKSFTNFTKSEGLASNKIRSMMEDKKGNLWFGTYGGGVSRYDGESFTNFTKSEGLANNTVFSILEDKRGNIWFGTYGGGVSRYDGKSFTNFTELEGLSNNVVNSLLEDKRGNIWIGTDNGMSLLQINTPDNNSQMSFRNINTIHGLPHEFVHSFIQDADDRLWINTEGGIALLKGLEKKQKWGNTDFHTFLQADGLKGLDGINNSAYIDHRNQAWWGTGKGLFMLDLNTFELPTKAPSIQLNGIDINEASIDYYQLQDSVYREDLREVKFTDVVAFQNYPIDLELPYELNHLTFQFSSIDWAAPHKLKYQYKLEGLDKNWSQLTKENKAEYRNLPHGSFTFKVKAIGTANKWSETFAYTFTIHPPWWFTWWAYTLYVLTAILFVFLFVQWRTIKLKQHQKKLEKTVKKRTQQLQESNKELNQTNEELSITLETVNSQKKEIEHSHRHITDSINYAKRIQTAVLPSEKLRNEILPEHFILFKPRDIVSGDFYWMEKVNNYLFIAVADCTGHGVPGAFMSMLGISYLNEIIRKKEIRHPNQALEELRNRIKETLHQTGEKGESKDGIDMAFYVIDMDTNKLQFSGAYNPLYIFRNKELTIYKANRQPIGIYAKEKPFSNHEIQLETGDTLYTFSDGYVDQFGGENGQKYLVKQFKETLTNIQDMNMKEQKQMLEQKLVKWQGEFKQIDDILVLGVKI